MESKKDIYNLWIRYTTKNEEIYFRQFISGFVSVWDKQLKLNLDLPELSSAIQHDSGPHLSRLPDELLPAIGKFLIIARDNIDEGNFSCLQLQETELLLKCLIVICRHFENIEVVAKSDYVSNAVAIASIIIRKILHNDKKPLIDEINFIKAFSNFLEVLYDPYLTWRNYLNGEFSLFKTSNPQTIQLHVEIVPFIYECFESNKMLNLPELGNNIINILGSIICGSQFNNLQAMVASKTGDGERLNRRESTGSCTRQNGLRAICPATVSILKNLLSNWECNNELRKLGLNCYVMMVIILQKSSPEQRQLDVITVLQMYGEIFNELLKTKHFIIIKPFEENFEISNSNNYSQYIDINALLVTIDNIENLLKESSCKYSICNALTEMNLCQRLINIPFEIQKWDINQQVIITSIIKIITLLSRNIENTKNLLIINKKNLQTLFNGIKLIERPQLKLIIECVNLSYDGINKKIMIGNILNELILWIKDIGEIEQNYLSDILLKICTANIDCKTVACHHRVIYTIAKCIGNYKLLTSHCAFDLIKIIEELGKHSIHPFELKEIFNLLRSEGKFIYRKQLLKAIVNISHHNITIGPQCTEFFDIQNETDCITVPEIRKWTVPNTYGFIFHAYLRFDKYLHDDDIENNVNNEDPNINNNYRRQIFSLMSCDNTGFEIFLKMNGKLVIGVLTKKEFLAATVPSAHLLDGRWHFITICVIPSKRPFSYNQINVYIDGTQKLGANVKFGSFTEHFVYCTIGSAVHKQRRISQSALNSTSDKNEALVEAHHQRQPSSNSGKGLFPSIMDRSFLPNLVSQVPNYFSLPSRNVSSLDPSVKSYPAGMQDKIFGEATCLKGQLGCVILAESTINIQTFLENGANFMRILSQDTEISDMMSKIIFCYSPSAYNDGLCVDLAPGSKYNGHVVAKHCRTIALQDCINCIGGVHTLLPVLENFSSNNNFDNTTIDDGFKTINLNTIESPAGDEYKDWEILQSSSYQEIKMSENMIACFLYLIRNFIMNHSLNQENLLKNEGVTLIGLLLEKCNPDTIDVNVLMAVQLLVEAVQSQIPQTNTELLQIFYSEIVFNFKIWSKTNFQITIGQIQNINLLIKYDRKYFRKKFGIQFILNVIKEYYIVPDNLTLDDCKTIRLSLLSIVKYYIQKELNVNEVNIIISFMAIEKHECIIIELINMLILHMESKNCKDQIFLLMYEPHTAELLYSLFADKVYTSDLYEVLLKLIDCLLHTKRVSTRHKTSLRLIDTNLECHSLYPGLFSYMIPFNVSSNVINMLLDQTLLHDSEVSGYSGTLALIHHLSLADITLKLDVCRKLLMTTFTKGNSPLLIAKQVDWQESIARLLIKKPITCSISNDDKTNLLVSDIDNFEEYSDTAKLIDENLITFDEKTMELTFGDSIKDGGAMLTEKLHASVSEAANVIENELKELADSVSGAVVGNITSVYSVIRQTTSDIQDTLESLAFGGSTDNDLSTKTRSSSISSTEDLNQISLTKSPTYSKKTSPTVDSPELAVDKEEQLVFLVTNILFTVLWRGVDNNGGDSWKERGQVMACINLLGLNNELYCSHLTIRLRILEMGIQASLIDLAENGTQNLNHQQNAAQLLRMVYDLVVLDPNEDHLKKCSTKLLDGVLALLDALMVFQQTSSDDWLEMTRLCLGLLLKCSSHPDPDIVAMATAKLHSILQSRNSQEPQECGYLMYSINKALQEAIEGHSELYSFLMPVMKALLEKTRMLFSLTTNVPDLPTTSSGPVFFHEFQMYSTTKQWTQFVEKKIKPLHDAFQKDVEKLLSEPLNIFWAECYEACKISSQKRAKMQMESRQKFQQKILIPWRLRQHEELTRLNTAVLNERIKYSQVERVWKNAKRFHYGPRGAWRTDAIPEQQFWKLSHHENLLRMRLKLEPTLYHDDHTQAANLRDNTAIQLDSRRLSTEFITPAVLRDINAEDELWLDEELRNTIESQTPDPVTATVEKEKIIITQECELVTLMTRVKGRLEVTVNQISFIDLTPANKEDGVKKDFKFTVNQIKEVHLRKYNLRRSALEIFLIDQISYFLNFTTKTRNKIFTKILSLQPPNILYGSGRSPAELLKASGLTQKWMTREISNFEYLMHLNTIAGRSYNDLSQYPVFPWILADYTNEILDLTNPKSFRDLSKPIGVVNPKNETEVRVKYEGFEDPSGMIPKFHYGTHYSNSAGVLHYLLRVEPFTSLHIELQSGRFDVADRQFHSIPQTWKLLMDNPNDVKELIPEFFYFPEFLKNMNKFDLGVLQITKERVDDVILPPWAKTPEDFIAIHRRALESEFVSHNLHHWIDLIFGYKQKGPRAVDALNVFYYCSYEGAVDLDKITNPTEREAVEGMINNFGQTPSQLLREAHPRRLTQDDIIMKLQRFELKRPDLTQFLDRIINVNCDMTTEKDPVIFLSQPRSPPRSFLQTSPDILVSITKSGILGSHSWISYDKEKGFLLEIDATTMNPKNKKQLIGPFHPSIKLNSQLFAVSHDGKLLYAGGIWDNSLKVFNINRCKAVASVVRHSDVITCLGLDNCGSYLVTGSRDCTCIVWSIGNFNQTSNSSSYQGNTGNMSNLSSSTGGSGGVSLAGGSMLSGSSTSSGMGGLNSSAMNLLHNVNHIGMTTSSTNLNTPNNIYNHLTPRHINTLYGHDDAITCCAINTELDLVVSGSLDGTVNVHTIHEGQFIRTLKPLGCTGLTIEISYLTISYQGHIGFSAFDDTSHSIHVFSINGTNLGSKYVSGRVTGLTTTNDFIIVADDAGDLTISRLYGLKPIYDIPLHIPVQTIIATTGSTHLMAPLRDGKISIIGISQPTTNKKHSVMNV